MKTADELPELERLIADMDGIGCTVTTSKTLIWIGGNTYPIRDSLKKNGWKWSPKKKQWWMSLDRYCGWDNHHGVEKIEEPNGDYKLCGKNNDGERVVIAECHFDSLV